MRVKPLAMAMNGREEREGQRGEARQRDGCRRQGDGNINTQNQKTLTTGNTGGTNAKPIGKTGQ